MVSKIYKCKCQFKIVSEHKIGTVRVKLRKLRLENFFEFSYKLSSK